MYPTHETGSAATPLQFSVLVVVDEVTVVVVVDTVVVVFVPVVVLVVVVMVVDVEDVTEVDVEKSHVWHVNGHSTDML
jgi:hypothetical protein